LPGLVPGCLAGLCENFLYGVKAPRGATRAADAAAWSSLTLQLPLLPARRGRLAGTRTAGPRL